MSDKRRCSSPLEPKSRKGQYNRRKKKKDDSLPIEVILAELNSSDSSNPGSPLDQSTPKKSVGETSNSILSHIGGETSISILSSISGETSNNILSDIGSEISNNILIGVGSEISNNILSGIGNETCNSIPSVISGTSGGGDISKVNLSGLDDEQFDTDQGGLIDFSYNTSLNISFFSEEDVENEDERRMALEENFLNYSVIDPSPNVESLCDDPELSNFNPINFDDPAQNYSYSSDEDSEDDIELNELLQYCDKEASAGGEELSGLRQFLREWSAENSTPLLSLSRLLKGLKEHHPKCFSELPADGRTIMGTDVRKLDVLKVPPGELIHLGIEEQLAFIANLISEDLDHLGLLFNIDGVKLYKHTKFSMYPILMMCPTYIPLKNLVFPISLYYGKGRPQDMELFLHPFIKELTSLLISDDFLMNGKIVKLSLLGFSCDTPARSEILETAGHSGFYSCFRCVTKGKSVFMDGSTRGKKRIRGKRVKRRKQAMGSKRVFPELNSAPREDIIFRNKGYPSHQPANRKLSPLVQLPGLNFPRSFILEPMHLIYLGVTKALLSLLFLGGPHMLKPSIRQDVQQKLEDCVRYLPSEFPRKPTQITSVGTMKAAEGRAYLLYLSVVILKNSLDKERYIHFMKLVIAMRIYHHPKFCASDEALALAKTLLQDFVSSVAILYGEVNMSHNMHSLYHFPEDIEWFKDSIPEFSANDISAFPPETFNQVFRRYTRGYSKTLQQNYRRLLELFLTDFWRNKYKKNMDSSAKQIYFKKKHNNGPLTLSLKGKQYEEAVFPRFILSVHQADCTFGTEAGDVVVALNFIEDSTNGEKFVVGKKFTMKSEFFGDPLPSSKKLGIYKVCKLSNFIEKWPLSSIAAKFVRLPYIRDESIPLQYRKQEFVVLPLMHSEAGPTTS